MPRPKLGTSSSRGRQAGTGKLAPPAHGRHNSPQDALAQRWLQAPRLAPRFQPKIFREMWIFSSGKETTSKRKSSTERAYQQKGHTVIFFPRRLTHFHRTGLLKAMSCIAAGFVQLKTGSGQDLPTLFHIEKATTASKPSAPSLPALCGAVPYPKAPETS